MAELTNEEVEERIAVLKRLRFLMRKKGCGHFAHSLDFFI